MSLSKKQKKIFNIVVVLSIIILCLAISKKSLPNDVFYTIKVGEHIFNNGIDMIDSFSWHSGLKYTYPHWLYDVVMYLIYLIGNWNGIYISTCVFVSILGVVIYFTNIKISNNYLSSFILTILTLFLLRNFIVPRAQLVTFILFAITIYCLEKITVDSSKKYGIMLFILSLLIANLHCAVWPFFIILFFPYIIESLFYKSTLVKKRYKLSKIVISKNKNIRYLIFVFVGCILMGFLTPLNFNPFTYLFRTLQGNSMQYIVEHKPLVLWENKDVLFIFITIISLFMFTKIKIKLRDLLMLSGLLLLAIMSDRQVSMLLVIGTLLFNKYLNQYLSSINYKKVFNVIEKYISSYAGGFFTVFCLSLILISRYITNYYTPYINNNFYPVKASDYILENIDLKKARIFNEYNYGSYLIYKEIPVFIDSRADLYTPEFNSGVKIFDDYFDIVNIKVDYTKKIKEYNITHIIIYKNSKLNYLLKLDENYDQIYSDKSFAIYEVNY